MSRRETLPPRSGERAAERRERAARIVAALHEAYPDAHCALVHETPFQLLVATILSAQCTDERVNMVTPALFERFPDAASMARADVAELERLVQPTGFFRQKAKNILATAQRISDVYGGEVPRTIEELTTLPGAARKTANVVISNCFPENRAGVVVDTHVQRIVRRLALVKTWEPEQVERELMRVLAPEEWNHFAHLLIDHGRSTCRAPLPRCTQCPTGIASNCPSFGRFPAPRG